MPARGPMMAGKLAAGEETALVELSRFHSTLNDGLCYHHIATTCDSETVLAVKQMMPPALGIGKRKPTKNFTLRQIIAVLA